MQKGLEVNGQHIVDKYESPLCIFILYLPSSTISVKSGNLKRIHSRIEKFNDIPFMSFEKTYNKVIDRK